MVFGMVLAVLLLLALLGTGGLSLLASRHVGADEGGHARSGSAARLGARVHDGLGRGARAVDVLVDPGPADEVPWRGDGAPDAQRTTYVVMGAGLVGLGLVLLLGVVLIAS